MYLYLIRIKSNSIKPYDDAIVNDVTNVINESNVSIINGGLRNEPVDDVIVYDAIVLNVILTKII